MKKRIWIAVALFFGVSFVLLRAATLPVENNIFLPSYQYFEMPDGRYVSVTGTMVSDDDNKLVAPLNTYEFTCRKTEKECGLKGAELWKMHDAPLLLGSISNSFPIKSWDDNFIIFSSIEMPSSCFGTTYRIDRWKKELSAVRTKSQFYTEEVCHGLGLQEFKTKLVDGFKVTQTLKRNWPLFD